ncbi:uncharacterized protein BO88DRAFT_405511, partial [Aspergillus vadensis CBS 113365]
MTIPRALCFPAKWPGRAEEVTEAVTSDDKGPTPGNVVAGCRSKAACCRCLFAACPFAMNTPRTESTWIDLALV